MILIEFLVLCVGLTVFMMQHTLRRRISLVGSKVVYWCTMLFVSLMFNSILYHAYPINYRLGSYANLSTLFLLIGIMCGYIIIQLLSPSRPYKKIKDKIYKNNKKKVLKKALHDSEVDTEEMMINHLEEIEEPSLLGTSEKNTYLKELHFETFLETICWLAIMFTITLELFNMFMGQIFRIEFMANELKDIVCLMMMLTIPIILRQIMYYLYSVRGIKEEQDLSELEVSFYHKLKKNHNRL